MLPCLKVFSSLIAVILHTISLFLLTSCQVMVFAKSYCPYCKRTKALLAEFEDSIDVHSIDLDLMEQEDGALIQMELLQQTGQRTVPNSEYQSEAF